jgi:hypothetical protein
MQSDFSQLGLFQEIFSESVRLFLVCKPALAGSGSCSSISSIWAEIGRENHRFQKKYKELGLENLCQYRSTPKTSNLWIKNHKKLNKSRDQNSMQFWGYFWIFKIYGGNHKSRVDPWQPKATDTI